jgi:hypothetical protein
MDILIEVATDSEVKRWNSPPDRVNVPNTGDVIYCDTLARPFDVGPAHFLATASIIEPSLGADQKRGAESVAVAGRVVTITRPAINLTAQEIADRDLANDQTKLQVAGLKLAHIAVELVTELIANGTIAATDFSAETRQMYQDIKTITDRLNP